MATYKGIKGVKVVTKTADPTASEAEGTVWYNSTGDALKYSIAGAGTWASGNAMNRTNGQGNNRGTGPSSVALAVGGNAPSQYGYTEQYDGTSWTVKIH